MTALLFPQDGSLRYLQNRKNEPVSIPGAYISRGALIFGQAPVCASDFNGVPIFIGTEIKMDAKIKKTKFGVMCARGVYMCITKKRC